MSKGMYRGRNGGHHNKFDDDFNDIETHFKGRKPRIVKCYYYSANAIDDDEFDTYEQED